MSRPVLRVVLCLVVLSLVLPSTVVAIPTGSYYGEGDMVYDDWDVCRTRGDGADGFLRYVGASFEPVIARESLGDNAHVAYSRGKDFIPKYPDRVERAEAIFSYVRDNVHYMSDKSQFGHVVFAQNADELYSEMMEEGRAYGDCEDYAVLLGVMCLGAGLRSAIVLAPDHAATLVYVPDYRLANRVLTVNGEHGWVWAEATGRNNPFGWMPERYMRVGLAAHELQDRGLAPSPPTDKPEVTLTRSTGAGFSLPVPPFYLIVGLLWLVSRLGRRRSPSR
ncbi:MAG: transglutaminase domain-containing protein [Chloroflexota bacterium]